MEPGRTIVLEGTKNTREMAGYINQEGKVFREKKLLRSDVLARVTDEDLNYLHDVYKLSYIIDLRCLSESASLMDRDVLSCRYCHIPVQLQLSSGLVAGRGKDFHLDRPDIAGTIAYIYMISETGDIAIDFEKVYRNLVLDPYSQKQYGEFLNILSRNEGCALVHCTDGKDRTGVGIAILMMLLGFDRKTIIEDYMKTNRNVSEKREFRKKYLEERNVDQVIIDSIVTIAGVRDNWIVAAMSEIDKMGGITQFAHEKMMISDDTIEKLKAIYLE